MYVHLEKATRPTGEKKMSEKHDHTWIANSGKAGEPVFKVNRQMSSVPIMHVRCFACGARTWMTEATWKDRNKVNK